MSIDKVEKQKSKKNNFCYYKNPSIAVAYRGKHLWRKRPVGSQHKPLFGDAITVTLIPTEQHYYQRYEHGCFYGKHCTLTTVIEG